MKREAVEEFVSSVVEGVIAGTNLELVDVDYVRERDWYLRVYLDKPGVSIWMTVKWSVKN